MDGKTTTVEHTNDMKKFMSIINEGSSPHKVSLPVQMAMSHYGSTLTEPKPAKPSLFQQYVAEAEDTIIQKQQDAYNKKRQITNQYAKQIAERIQMKENTIPGHSMGFTSGVGPGLQSNAPIEEDENPKDVVSMDIPLLIRLLEYSREDAKTDMDLHNVTERLIQFSKNGDVLSMEQYDAIVGTQKLLPKK